MATSEGAPSYAPEDPTLPKPWTGLIDGSTGVLYYWNPETNATQYEKPAPLPPPSAMGPPPNSTPKLAPIPIAHSQPPNDNIYQHELDRQMPQQPHQLSNHHTYPPANQPTQHYQYMQMNQMAPPQFPKTNEGPVPHYPGQQQYQGQQQGLAIGNPQPHQNGYPVEMDTRRQVGEPVSFAAAPVQQSNGVSGDGRFPGSVRHFPQVADYSVHPEQHFGRPPSTGTGGAFSDMQQTGADAIHRQQPLGGPAVKNQTENALSRPLMDQKLGLDDDHHGRGRNVYYSSSNKDGPMMPQQQPQLGVIPHAGNRQDIRLGTIPQPVTSSHPSGLIRGQEVEMPKFHDHAAFPNMPTRGPSQNLVGSTDFTKNQAADSYCQHHEITVTGDRVPAPFMTFAATGVSPEILREMRYLLQRRAYVVGCAAIHPSTQQLLSLKAAI